MHQPLTLTIAHCNDTHSHFDQQILPITLKNETDAPHFYCASGGFARLKSGFASHRARAEKRGQAFVGIHAGDCFQGTLYFARFKGAANAALLSQLDLDMMTLGNHELDLGNAPVADFLDHINFPMLAGNMWTPPQANALSEKSNWLGYNLAQKRANYLVKTFQGEPVAFIGLVLEQMPLIANPDASSQFFSEIDTLRATIDHCHANNINKIVVVSHLGFERDCQIAGEVQGIAAIIGGHSHTVLGDFRHLGYGNHGDYPTRVGNCAVVQAGCNSLFLGALTLELDSDGTLLDASGHTELLIGSSLYHDQAGELPVSAQQTAHWHQALKGQLGLGYYKQDAEMNAAIAVFRAQIEDSEQAPITLVRRHLRHTRIPDEKGGSQVAPWVCESMLWQAQQHLPEVQFAIHNAGGVRADLNQGSLSAATISGSVLPFAIPLTVYWVKGKSVQQALEGAINNALNLGIEGTGTGSFPYTAKLKYHFDGKAPQGERITQLAYFDGSQWLPIDMDAHYCAVSSGYTAAGKEGYDALTQQLQPAIALNETLADAFERYLSQFETLGKHPEQLIECAHLYPNQSR